MKKYDSVIRLGKSSTDFHQVGDEIVVQEKLDGANASFERVGEGLAAYSRNKELDSENTLNGYYSYLLENVEVDRLNENYIYYGEWLTKHKIDYGEHLNNFFLFDVFDKTIGRYKTWAEVVEIAQSVQLKTVPVFYVGDFKSYNHVAQYVGKSILLDNDEGEGVVLKNESRDDYKGNQTFVKLVSQNFLEKKAQQNEPKSITDLNKETLDLFNYLTIARIEKQFYKKNEEQGIDFVYENFSVFMKGLGQLLLEDILKEESDEIEQGYSVEAFFKKVGHIAPPVLRGIIKDKTEFRIS